jgi:hypothetical protein
MVGLGLEDDDSGHWFLRGGDSARSGCAPADDDGAASVPQVEDLEWAVRIGSVRSNASPSWLEAYIGGWLLCPEMNSARVEKVAEPRATGPVQPELMSSMTESE